LIQITTRYLVIQELLPYLAVFSFLYMLIMTTLLVTKTVSSL